MNKKVIKFIKNNWLYVLFLFFIMSIGYFLGSSFRVDAYQLDSNGNITSDNLIDNSDLIFHNGEVYNSSGGVDYWSGYYRIDNYFDVLPSTTYYFKIDNSIGWSPIAFYDINKSFISSFVVNSENISFVTPSTARFIRISSNIAYDNFELRSRLSLQTTPISFYEPYGLWLSSSNVDELLNGYLNISSISATWNGGSLSDASSYVYNKDGLVWVDGIFDYISSNSSDGSYTNSNVTISFDSRMPTNVNYSYSFVGSIGSSISFYQGNSLIYSINITDVTEGSSDLCSSMPSSNLCVINLSEKINFNLYTYFDKVVLWSANYDHKPLSFGYYSSSFYRGYTKGYQDGYGVGHSNGFSDGNSYGYNRGYDVGFDDALSRDAGPNTLVGMIGAIFTGPVNMFQSIFNFEFLGVNLSELFFSLITLLLVVWLILKFW